jgi:hypothetical protein
VTKSEVIFKEVIRPPLWLLGFIYFMFLSLVVAIWAALDNRSALIAWVFSTLAILAIARAARSTIEVTDKELIVGRAHIDLRYISKIEELNTQQMRLLRTRDADPASYLAITFWISTGVKITLQDDRDPTPYWLISCKKSKELTSTLYRLP